MMTAARGVRRAILSMAELGLAAGIAQGAVSTEPQLPGKELDRAVVAARGVAYYVDAVSGRDTNSGTSQASAWKTIARANRADLDPGDRLLFAAGQSFAGTLKLERRCRGAASGPVTISSYGHGRATIDGGAGHGIAAEGCAYVIIRGMRIVGCGRKDGSDGVGVKLDRTHNVTLDDLDVSGFRVAGIWTGGDADTRITHVYAHDNGGAGITTYGDHDGI